MSSRTRGHTLPKDGHFTRGVGRYSMADSGWARFTEELCRSKGFENTREVFYESQ
jgi:hypothetical protein